MRWLCNDEQQQRARYTPFDIEAMEQIACRSVAAQRCISWKKIGEGAFNKVFLLEFDNATEAVLRIPCRIVGNVELSTASEVATMSYIRERWENYRRAINPPKVIAWDASYRNPARTPFILMEYVPGVPLSARWTEIEGDSAVQAVFGIWVLDRNLLFHPFSQNGSLYFADDISDELRSRPLYPSDTQEYDDEFIKKLAAKYRIGPTANREWWRGEYAQVEANRGPWPDLEAMLKSAAEFQLGAINSGVVDFSAPYIRSKPADIPLIRRLLDMCIRVAPFIAPRDPELITPVLNHPDFSRRNIIVPPDGLATPSSVIDWQGATVAPFCTQVRIPDAVFYDQSGIRFPTDGSEPELPDNFDTFHPEDLDIIRTHLRLARRHHWYATTGDIRRLTACSLPHNQTLMNIITFTTRCVAEGPQNLHDFMVELQLNWSEIASVPCPLDFSDDELAEHATKVETRAEYDRNVARLYIEIGCAVDGTVAPEEFEKAQQAMERCRAEWDEEAMKGPFPFFEGAYACHLN